MDPLGPSFSRAFPAWIQLPLAPVHAAGATNNFMPLLTRGCGIVGPLSDRLQFPPTRTDLASCYVPCCCCSPQFHFGAGALASCPFLLIQVARSIWDSEMSLAFIGPSFQIALQQMDSLHNSSALSLVSLWGFHE